MRACTLPEDCYATQALHRAKFTAHIVGITQFSFTVFLFASWCRRVSIFLHNRLLNREGFCSLFYVNQFKDLRHQHITQTNSLFFSHHPTRLSNRSRQHLQGFVSHPGLAHARRQRRQLFPLAPQPTRKTTRNTLHNIYCKYCLRVLLDCFQDRLSNPEKTNFVSLSLGFTTTPPSRRKTTFLRHFHTISKPCGALGQSSVKHDSRPNNINLCFVSGLVMPRFATSQHHTRTPHGFMCYITAGGSELP